MLICDLLTMSIPRIQNLWKTYKFRLVLYMAKMVFSKLLQKYPQNVLPLKLCTQTCFELASCALCIYWTYMATKG